MYPRVPNRPKTLAKAWRPYVAALLAVVVALVVRTMVHPFLQTEEPSTLMAYTTLMVASAFSAWFLGWRPSLLAIGLGLFVGDFLFTPQALSVSAFSRNELPETITYLVACTVFLVIGLAKQKSPALLMEKSLQIQEANERLREMSANLLRALDQERRKIARELHDSVGQYLSALGMIVGGLRDAKGLPNDVLEKLQQAAEAICSCTEDFELRALNFCHKYHLSQREGEAVRFLIEGLTNKEIAARMGISPDTVKVFLRLAMMKMEVSSRSGIMSKFIHLKESDTGPAQRR